MLLQDPKTKKYSADIKRPHLRGGRVHLHLKTKDRAVAMRRHTALELLIDTGEPVRDLIDALRDRKISIVAVEECVRAKLPFDTLRASTWPTLGAARDLFIKTLELREQSEQGAVNTVVNTVTALTRVVAHFGEDKPIDRITHDDVAGFRAHLLTPVDDGGAGLHSNTVTTYMTRFGALFTFLQEREVKRARQGKRTPAVLFSPVDRDEHVGRMVKTRVRFLSQDEAWRVLAATPDRIAFAIALGLYAGLRVGETLHLRPHVDVNLDRKVIYVQAREGWAPKYRRNREIPISAALEPYARKHMAMLPEGARYLFSSTNPDRPMPVSSLHAIVRRIVSDAGLETGRKHRDGVTYHTLRHTFASWLVMESADLLTISKLMGHTSTQQLEQTYGHLSPEHLRATVEMLSKFGRADQQIPAIPEVGEGTVASELDSDSKPTRTP